MRKNAIFVKYTDELVFVITWEVKLYGKRFSP